MIVQLLIIWLPWRLRRLILRYLCGHQIHPDTYVGRSIISAASVKIAAGCRVGHGNLITGLARFEMGENAQMGSFNRISGNAGASHFKHVLDRDPSLLLGREGAITNRHLIDCTDRVTIGAFATFAGWGNQILTHAIEFAIPRQETARVEIGDYCFVGTHAVILKGAVLPSHSVLAAGGVLGPGATESWSIYGGVPAKKIGDVDRTNGYFSRAQGYVL